MDIERVQRNANLDNSGVFNPQLIIPTTFRDCLTYEQQIVFLFRMKQNKLIEGDNITLTDNGDGTVTISADGGSSSGATYELVSVTPDEGYSSAYILENADTGEQSGVKIQIPEVEDGVGISSITFDQAVAGGNQYDVNLTDGSSYQIIAPKGNPGTNGTDGTDGVGISSITFDSAVAGGNQYNVNLTNGTSYQIVAPKGEPGTNGDDGDDGVGISSITFDQAVAGGNQYDVNLTDGTSYQIVAPKGDTGAGIPTITPTTDQGKVLTVNSSDQAEWGTPSGGVPAITPSTDRGKVLAVNNSDQAEWASKGFVPSHTSSNTGNALKINDFGNAAWSSEGITFPIGISFTTSSVLSQTTDYQDIILNGSVTIPRGLARNQVIEASIDITDGNNDKYYGIMYGKYSNYGTMMRLTGELCKPVAGTSSGQYYYSDTTNIFTDAIIYVPASISSTHNPVLKGKYIDCTNPPSGGSFEYTDQYGLPSNIPQIKFGCQVTMDELMLGTPYHVTLGPEYMPDGSGEEEPTPGSLENGVDLFDYVSDNSISAPGVVVPVNFSAFDLYCLDPDDNYMEIAQLQGGTWTAKGFYSNGNAILNIEGIFRSSDFEKFVYLRLQLKSPDGLAWSSYNSTACTITPLLGTFRAM